MHYHTRQSAAASPSASNVDLTYYNTVSSSKGGGKGGKKNKIQVGTLTDMKVCSV